MNPNRKYVQIELSTSTAMPQQPEAVQTTTAPALVAVELQRRLQNAAASGPSTIATAGFPNKSRTPTQTKLIEHSNDNDNDNNDNVSNNTDKNNRSP